MEPGRFHRPRSAIELALCSTVIHREEAIPDTDDSWEVEEEKGVQTLPTPPDLELLLRSGAGGAHRWRSIRLVLE